MQDICKFLVDYWKPLFGIFMCLVSLIITLFKKRPQVASAIDYIYRIISDSMPGYINLAESKFQNGPDKLIYVVGECMKDLQSYIILDDNAKAKARFVFQNACEIMLSTPQKKA